MAELKSFQTPIQLRSLPFDCPLSRAEPFDLNRRRG